MCKILRFSLLCHKIPKINYNKPDYSTNYYRHLATVCHEAIEIDHYLEVSS